MHAGSAYVHSKQFFAKSTNEIWLPLHEVATYNLNLERPSKYVTP